MALSRYLLNSSKSKYLKHNLGLNNILIYSIFTFYLMTHTDCFITIKRYRYFQRDF